MHAKNAQLEIAFKEKRNALQDLAKKYQALKDQAEMGPRMAAAAAVEAEQAVDTAVMDELQSRQGYQDTFKGYIHNEEVNTHSRGYRPNRHSWQERPAGHAGRMYTARKESLHGLLSSCLHLSESIPVPVTPHNGSNYQIPHYSRGGLGHISAHGPTRQPLNPIEPNLPNPTMSGYGMSAGIKMGRPARPLSHASIPHQTGPPNMPIR